MTVSCLLWMVVSLAGTLPAQSPADYQTALEHFQNQRYFEALSISRQLASEAPRNADYHHLHGLTMAALGQFTDALAELRTTVELAPEKPSFHHDLGMTYLQIGEEKAAADSLQEAVRLDGDDLLARLYLGRLFHNQNRSRDALEQFQVIEKKNARFPTLYYHKARVHLSLGDAEAARSDLLTEISHFPANPLPRLELAELLIKMGDADGARRQLEALAQSPAGEGAAQPARFYRLKARILQMDGQVEAAMASVETAIGLDPEDPQGHYLKGILLRDLGNAEGAKLAMRRFEELSARQNTRSP